MFSYRPELNSHQQALSTSILAGVGDPSLIKLRGA